MAEVQAHTPEVSPHLTGAQGRRGRAILPRGDADLHRRGPAGAESRRWRWSAAAFAWDDIGTWQALTRVRPKDTSGNLVVGTAFMHESEDCIVWSDRDTVVLSGVQDLIVVQANGRILVMPT